MIAISPSMPFPLDESRFGFAMVFAMNSTSPP